jgi:Fur family ferric uptake transcriptional regulator
MSVDVAAPSVAEDPRDAIPQLLARRGYRITAPRRAVLDALATSQEPRTVAQLHRALGVERVNLVSVYRTVNLLCEVGLVRATDAAQGQRRYELAEPFTAHHHHLICRRCGHIEDLEGCLLEADVLVRLARRVRQSRRFRVTDHELRFFGVCRRCDGSAERGPSAFRRPSRLPGRGRVRGP